MTVTEYRRLTPKKIAVFVDGDQAFTISPRQLAQWDFVPEEGAELPMEQGEAFWKEAERYAAHCAMNRLVRRDYAISELREALMRNGFSQSLAQSGVDYACSYGYMDDERFASEYVISRKENSSRQMLVFRLREKGVSDDIIEKVLEREGPDEAENIRRIILKKYAGTDLPEKGSADYQKLCRSLVRRGYSWRDISRACLDCREAQKKET